MWFFLFPPLFYLKLLTNYWHNVVHETHIYFFHSIYFLLNTHECLVFYDIMFCIQLVTNF
jgi:hypothetical protein